MRKSWIVPWALLTGCGGEASEEGWRLDSVAAPLRRSSTLQSVWLHTGVQMTYVEQGSPRGKPVLLLHGFTDSHHSFDLNLPRLPSSLHVFAIDQRGHGDSSKPDCCYGQADFARDVVAFLDAVGIERASIIGHSMGSFIAQSVALAYPSRVDELVLMSSAPTVAENPAALELKSVVDTLRDPIDPAFARGFQASTFFRPVPEAVLERVVGDSLKVPAAVWQQALAGLIAEDHSAQLGSIASRTLLLFGDQDIFVTAEDQAALAAAIPRSRLVTYEQTGHGLHVERPARVSRDIVRFLR